MRRVLLTVLTALVVALPAVVGSGKRAADHAPPAAAPQPQPLTTARGKACPNPPPLSRSLRRPEAERLAAVGVGSCASMGCHNAGGPRGSAGSEYSTWIAVDPHAKAMRTLYKPESKRMHALLAEAFPSMRAYKGASTNPLCLKCHGMGASAPERFQGDGVGCERCHGPAEKWKTTHYLNDFDRATPGFVDTRCDLVARAYTCMKCHVGDASQEVDHILIAAGHPRLRFEYAAYHVRYPRHWADLGEKQADPTFEAYTWALGQLVTARAALELLFARATEPSKEPNWPEFAEFDCTACHHDLQKDSPRQARSLRFAGVKRAGDLPWGTWYYPLLPVLGKHVSGAPVELAAVQAELDRLMRLRFPPREQVASTAKRSMDLLDAWMEKVIAARATGGKPSFTEPQLRSLTRDLAMQTDLVERGWDGGSQVYLSLAALHQARADADPAFAATSPLRPPLAEVKMGLKHSFDPGARTLYDTPNRYFGQLGRILGGLDTIRRER